MKVLVLVSKIAGEIAGAIEDPCTSVTSSSSSDASKRFLDRVCFSLAPTDNDTQAWMSNGLPQALSDTEFDMDICCMRAPLSFSSSSCDIR